MANNHEFIIHNSKLMLVFRFNRKLCLFYFIILLKSQISHSPKHKIDCRMTDTTATMSSSPTSSCKNILNKLALKKNAYQNQQHIISKEKVSKQEPALLKSQISHSPKHEIANKEHHHSRQYFRTMPVEIYVFDCQFFLQ